ncbi:MAG TPA: cytochrome C oxidase subunit IV family protein [Thermoplasmata archaeon]
MAMETQGPGMAAVAKAAHEVKKPYALVFLFLAIVTVLEIQIPTYGASVLGLLKTEQIILLMATAVAKGSFVALYYMHLKYEPLVLKYLPIVPLVLVAILVLTLVA